MFVLLFPILSLFITVQALAQTNEIALLLNQVESASDPVACEENPLDQCVIDLCGPANEIPNYLSPIQQLDTTRYPLPQNTKERLTRLVDRQIQEARNLALSLSRPGAMNAPSENPMAIEHRAKETFVPHLRLEVNPALPQNARVSITLNPPADATPEFREGLRSFSEAVSQAFTESPEFAMSQGFYTPEEAQELLRSKWAELQVAYQNRTIPRGTSTQAFQTRYDHFITLMRNPQALVKENFREVLSLEAILKSLNRGETFDGYYIASPRFCRGACLSVLTRRSSDEVAQFNSLLNAPNAREELLEQCFENFQLAHHAEQSARALRARIPAETELIINRSMTGSSEHSKSAYRRLIQERLNVVTGDTSTEELLARDEASVSALDQTTLAEALRDQTFAPNLKSCQTRQQFLVQQGTDGFSFSGPASEPVMNLSSFSCSHHEHGQQVLTHELGHILSYAMMTRALSESSLESFRALRNCASQLNPNDLDSRSRIFFPTDTRYTEEDVADIIAFRANVDNPTLLHCALMPRSTDGAKYDTSLVIAPRRGQSHSGFLARLLKEVFYKNRRMPATCQRVIDQNQPMLKMEKCP